MKFMGGNPPSVTAEKLPAYVKAASEAFPTIKAWGVVGVCLLSWCTGPCYPLLTHL